MDRKPRRVTDRLKPSSVTIKGQLEIVTYAPNGVELIHQAFATVQKISSHYLGGGKYSIEVTAKDYKKAEAFLKTDLDAIEKAIAKKSAKYVFERTDR